MPINSFLYPGAKVPPPYEVANSLRFDDDSSHSLTRTFGSGDQKTWTWSAWVKKTANLTTLGNFDFVLFNGYQDTNNRLSIFYSQTQADGSVDDCLKIFGTASGSTSVNAFTSALYRDNSAWYHVVCAFDTTQATGSNRIKIYVNGVQQTLTFGTTPAQDSNQSINFNQNHTIGNYNTNTASTEFDGYMAEVVFVDGTALDPTSFGEFDEDTGIWKPINVSGLTFGTNGFYLDFEDSSALGNDVSGNNNDFTVNNLTSVDQSTDTCTNNFATLNGVSNPPNGYDLSEGNLKATQNGSSFVRTYIASSIAPSQGKWYWESKLITSGGSDRTSIGICSTEENIGTGTTVPQNEWSLCTGYSRIRIRENGSTTEVDSFYSVPSANDIFMYALDLDNTKFYFGINGDWFNYNSGETGGDPTSGSGYVTNSTNIIKGNMSLYIRIEAGAVSTTFTNEFNFGNPPYSISSGNSDGNGYGNFEYSVPSGYYALNSKNLAEYG